MITALLVISVISNIVLVSVLLKNMINERNIKEATELKAKKEAEEKQKAYINGLLKKIDDLNSQVNHVEACIAERDATIKRLEDSMNRGQKLVETVKVINDAISPLGLGKTAGNIVTGTKGFFKNLKEGFKEGYLQATIQK